MPKMKPRNHDVSHEPTETARAVGAPLSIIGGSLCGIAAAVLYTCANVALRWCSNVDPFLVSSIKAVPTVVVLGPVLLVMLFQGRSITTNRSAIPKFALVAVFGQFFGNAAFQVALGIIGLAASVPITLGVLLIGGGIFGRILLGEPLRRKTMLAISTLIAAVVVLSLSRQPSGISGTGPVWFGAACAATSGAAFSLFGTIMRQTLNNGVSAPLAMFISGVIGATSLSLFTLTRMDLEAILSTPNDDWWVMSVAGVFNFVAFVALSLALKSLPVVAVNLINASQVAMAAIAGVLIFSEAVTPHLIIGISLTIVGLLILGYRRPTPASE